MAQSQRRRRSQCKAPGLVQRRQGRNAGSSRSAPANTETATAATPAPVPAAAPARRTLVLSARSRPVRQQLARIALAQRKALSTQGKRADTGAHRTLRVAPRPARRRPLSVVPEAKDGSGGCGCKDREGLESSTSAPSATPGVPPGRSSVSAAPRRRATQPCARHGASPGADTWQGGHHQRQRQCAAQTARAVNPGLSSRELTRARSRDAGRAVRSGAVTAVVDVASARRTASRAPRKTRVGKSAGQRDQPWSVRDPHHGRDGHR